MLVRRQRSNRSWSHWSWSRWQGAEEIEGSIEEAEVLGGRKMIDSTKREQPGIANALSERFTRSGEISIADDDQGSVFDTREFWIGRSRAIAFHHRSECDRVVPGLMGVLRKQSGHYVGRVTTTFDRIDDSSGLLRIWGLEYIATDSGEHHAPQAMGMVDHDAKKRHGSEGESHGIARLIGQSFEDDLSEIVVRQGVVWFG